MVHGVNDVILVRDSQDGRTGNDVILITRIQEDFLIRVINNVLVVVENFSKLRGIIKILTDTLEITENFNRLRNQVRVFTETVSITETSNRLLGFVKVLTTDIVAIVERVNLRIITSGAGIRLIRTMDKFRRSMDRGNRTTQ